MAISNREFVPGTLVAVKFRGVVHMAEAFMPEGGKKLHWRIVQPVDFVAPVDAETDKGLSGGDDRKTFQSIGYAEMGIFGRRTGPSEYQFWTLAPDFDPETAHDYGVRTVVRGEPKAPKTPRERKARTARSGEEPRRVGKRGRKPKAATTTPVVDGEVLPIHKLEGNETTWFCDGCMAPFEEIAGIVAEVCPNGHTNESLRPTIVTPDEAAAPADEADVAEVAPAV